MIKERVTVDLDAECYYLDGEFWVSWDHYGEEMADSINILLNKQEETIQKQNQEIIACHDTLTTIHELCNAVLNYDFKNVTDKVDFCHMLNEMDNKDLMFLKECFEAIKYNDLKQMTNLTNECNLYVENEKKEAKK